MKYPFLIERTEVSRLQSVDFKNLQFGKLFGDHMFVAECRKGRWTDCRIIPYGNLPFSPASSALHYGQIIFEGMKAFKDPEGNPILFRPEMNYNRFNISAQRMAMPQVPLELWLDALHELISLDQDWIPQEKGCSLYIRPFMFAMDRFIGVRPTEFFKFIIITSPSGLYYPKPVKVITTQQYVRAFPGGVGFAKAAGNYGASMLPLKEAIEKGFDQILWTDGNEHKYIQEIGTMNVFFVIDGVAITPELDGTILDGVTRDSTIQFFKYYGVKVEERKISVDEVFDAHKKRLLQDAFGTGTAASIVPISHIHHGGITIELPPASKRPYSISFKDEMEEIKAGIRTDPFGWSVKVQTKLMAEV
ncbi:MAG TPA: branched-chain amino acid aminotransferase [Chitinophagales bacterium]|nr:branched-chain amino acid aminotransferase [Chitinophagales bacterium]